MLSISSSGEMEGEVVGEGEKVEVGEFTGQELANLVTLVRVRGYLEVNCGMTQQEVSTVEMFMTTFNYLFFFQGGQCISPPDRESELPIWQLQIGGGSTGLPSQVH